VYTLEIRACYGNTSNDIHVYGVIGMPKEKVFIVGPQGSKSDPITKLGKDYVAHFPWLEKLEPAKVPAPAIAFDWG